MHLYTASVLFRIINPIIYFIIVIPACIQFLLYLYNLTLSAYTSVWLVMAGKEDKKPATSSFEGVSMSFWGVHHLDDVLVFVALVLLIIINFVLSNMTAKMKIDQDEIVYSDFTIPSGKIEKSLEIDNIYSVC